VKLATHLHLGPRLIMNGGLLLFPPIRLLGMDRDGFFSSPTVICFANSKYLRNKRMTCCPVKCCPYQGFEILLVSMIRYSEDLTF
jgi:hypothetical protein